MANIQQKVKVQRRTNEKIKKDRENLKKYLIENHNDKITFKKIKHEIYRNRKLDDRTIRNDLKAIDAITRSSRYYTLKKIDDLIKCMEQMRKLLKEITLYCPVWHTHSYNLPPKFDKLPKINISTLILIGNSYEQLFELHQYLKQYAMLQDVILSEFCFDIRINDKSLQLDFLDDKSCLTILNLLYYLKFEPEEDFLKNTQIKLLISELD